VLCEGLAAIVLIRTVCMLGEILAHMNR